MSSDCVVWVYVAAKLASGFIASSGISFHVDIRCCIVVGGELFGIGGCLCPREGLPPSACERELSLFNRGCRLLMMR